MDEALKHRVKILEYLEQGKRLTTLYAREEMGVMHPGARVMELRSSGYKIETVFKTEKDALGRPHRVAEYYLAEHKPIANRAEQGDLFSEEGGQHGANF